MVKFNKKDYTFNGWDLDDVLEEFEHALEGDMKTSSPMTVHKLHLNLASMRNTTDLETGKKRNRRKTIKNLFE